MNETPGPAGPATGANCLSPLPAPRSDALVVPRARAADA